MDDVAKHDSSCIIEILALTSRRTLGFLNIACLNLLVCHDIPLLGTVQVRLICTEKGKSMPKSVLIQVPVCVCA